MTFLELVRAVVRRAQISSDGIDTLVGVPEEIALIAQIVSDAEQSIVSKYTDWRFNRGVAVMRLAAGTTVVGDTSVGWPSDLGGWHQHSFWRSPNSAKAARLPYLSYTDWRAQDNHHRRESISILPDDSLGLTWTAGGDDTIRGDYRRRMKVLREDGDISVIPEQYHLAIRGLALMSYAEIEGAPELHQAGFSQFESMYDLLQAEQLPEQFAVATATNDSPTVVHVP